MKRLFAFVLSGLALIALAAASLYFYPVESFIYRHMAERVIAQPAPELAAPNQLSVLLCGTGSPLPDKDRGGPCTLVAAGDKYYLIDAGIDAARNLRQWRIPLEKPASAFLRTFHRFVWLSRVSTTALRSDLAAMPFRTAM